MKLKSLLIERNFSRNDILNMKYYTELGRAGELEIVHDTGMDDVPLNKLSNLVQDAKKKASDVVEFAKSNNIDAKLGNGTVLHVSVREYGDESSLYIYVNVISKDAIKILELLKGN